jgi:hypothetical protein
MTIMLNEKINFDKISDVTSIILEDRYREQIINQGIKKAGSMFELGRILGYPGVSPNWNVKNIRSGKQGFPLFRLIFLCDFLNINFDELKKHIVQVGRKKNI